MNHHPSIEDSDLVSGLNVAFLKYFGLWKVINDFRTTGKKNTIIQFQLVGTLVLTIPYIILQYLSFFFTNVDMTKIIFKNLHLIPPLQFLCKIVVFWKGIEWQCRLCSLMKKDFVKFPNHEMVTPDKIFKKVSKTSNMLCFAALIIDFSIFILNIIVPGIPVDYITKHTGDILQVTEGKMKILCAWYPLPMDESPFYEAIFAYEVVLLVWVATLQGGYVCFYYQVLSCLAGQFNVLAFHASKLKISESSSKVTSKQKEHNDEMLTFIKYHKKLLSYAEELRRIYNPLVTMILGMGVLVLIISVVQFLSGKTGSPMFIVKSLQFLLYQVIEAGMFCLGSSQVETASSDLQFAIYSSDWYKADKKYRTEVQMVMVRARKGWTLTAVSMYPVNVETMMNVFQFTYTIAALISRESKV